MADRNKAINFVQKMIDLANCHGNVGVFKGDGVERLENVLACLTKGQKSAVEMFEGLGYRVRPDGCCDDATGEKTIRFFGTEEAVDFVPFVSIELHGKYEVCVTFDEIHAIAQFIAEMEADSK